MCPAGDTNWLTVATGITNCYYNVTDLPPGGAFRFRVSCVNKAGQGPHSNSSAPVSLGSAGKEKGPAVGASPAVAVVKTAPTSPQPIVTSSVTVPPLKPVQNSAPRTTASVLTSASSPQTTSPSSKAGAAPTPLSPPAGATAEDARKLSSTLPSPPASKAPPPFVLPKPQSPVNVVTPMTQTPPISPPPPLVTPPSTPTKPAVASVPTYVPSNTTTARVAPTPVSFSPPVLQTSSLSPIGEGAGTPARGTPSGRATPSTALRQGVPQKPYTFLEEKAR